MTAHKHAAMIKAKADNMDLVVFVKNSNTGDWFEALGDLPFNQQQDFFMCLPKHKEACLHWLSGGSVEFLDVGGDWHWYGCSKWSASGIRWMSKDATIRIKPRKEKRWIAVTPDGHVSDKHFSTKEECCVYVINEYLPSFVADAQYKEIEVEI